MLKYNGKTIEQVYFNNTKVKKIVCNGKTVFEETGQRIPAGTYTNSAFKTIVRNLFGTSYAEHTVYRKAANNSVNVTVNGQTITVPDDQIITLTSCGNSPFSVEGLVFGLDGKVKMGACDGRNGFTTYRTYLLRKAAQSNRFADTCENFTIKFSTDLYLVPEEYIYK